MEALKSLADLEENPFPDGQCRLILVGKTGNGKSSTGNSILGRKAFKPQIGINSKTEQGALESVMKDGLEIQVFDALKRIFGEKMTSYLVVVLVKRDLLEEHGVSFEQQLQECSKLKKLLVEANNRYILFDNRPQLSEEKKREQVDQLLAKVREVVVGNGGYCFRHMLSVRLDNSMNIIKKAELKVHDPDPAASDLYSQDVKPPKPKTRTFGAQKKEESTAEDGSGKSTIDMNQSIQRLEQIKTVTTMLKQFECGAPNPEFSQGDIASKFKLKPQDAATKRRKSPTNAGRSPQAPPKPPRLRLEAAEDKETKRVPELLRNFEVKSPNEETRPARDDDTTTSASFAYEVPDRPGMRMCDKQRMVEEVLKRKLARGTEDLNEEQIEELEKTAKVLWEQFKQKVSKTVLKSIGLCRLM